MMKSVHYYYFKGIKNDNEVKKGFLIAQSEREVIKRLIESGLSPTIIKKIPGKAVLFIFYLAKIFKIRMSNKKFSLWWMREMADLLNSGLSLRLAIESTIHKTRDWYYKLVLYQVYQDIFAGSSFFLATKKAKLFSETESIAIQSAEKNHCLSEALLGIHQYLSQKNLYKAHCSIMAVPYIFFIILTLFVSYYIANHVLNIYIFDLWLQGKSPSHSSQLFIDIYTGSLPIKLGIALLILLSIQCITLITGLLPFEKIKHSIQKISLWVPLKKTAVRRQQALYFLSSLSFSLRSKLPIHAAFYQASHAVPYPVFRLQLIKVYHKIYEGLSLEEALQGLSLLDTGDKLVLQTCLSNYTIDNNSIDQLVKYTYLQLKNFQMLTVKLTHIGLLSTLIGLNLFMVASTFNIIALDYF